MKGEKAIIVAEQMVSARGKRGVSGLTSFAIGFMLVFIISSMLVFTGCTNPFNKSEADNGEAWDAGALFKIDDVQYQKRELYTLLLEANREYTSKFGDAIWEYEVADGLTMGDQISYKLLERAINTKLICSKAAELGVSITDDERALSTDKAKKYLMTFDDETRMRFLMYGVSEDAIAQLYRDNYLSLHVFDKATDYVTLDVSDEDMRQHSFYSLYIRKYKIDENGDKVPYTSEENIQLEDKLRDVIETAKTRADVKSYMYANTELKDNFYVSYSRVNIPENLAPVLLPLRTGGFSELVSEDEYFVFYYCVSEDDKNAEETVRQQLLKEAKLVEFEKVCSKWYNDTRIEINYETWAEVLRDSLGK